MSELNKIIDWWETLSYVDKFEKVIEFYGTDRQVYDMTNDEIEFIYNQSN